MSAKLASVFCSCITVVFAVAGLAQDSAVPAEKKTPTKIYPTLFVVLNEVVEEQWKTTLDLVNGPTDLKDIEPGQCVRFGILVSGDDRNQSLASAKLYFEFSFAGQSQNSTGEAPETVRQVKPEGGDFVTQALSAAGLKNPVSSMVSLAASRMKWCVPVDARDGMVTIQAKTVTSDGKSFSLKPRKVNVKTFETARKANPLKDMNRLEAWLQHYHTAPQPANLLPALRIVAADEKARSMPNIMVFFVEAFKSSPAAASELLQMLPKENRSVQMYSIPLLSAAGYAVGPLLDGFKENERNIMESFKLPNAFDLTADQSLPNRMDMLWAVFFATGRFEPVRTIASMLAWRPDYDKFVEMRKSGQKPTELTESIMRGVSYTAAGWSLSALSRDDGLVADYVDALKASPNTPANVKEELANLHTNPAFRKQ